MIARSPHLGQLLVSRMLVLGLAVTAVFLLLTSAEADEPPPPAVEHVVTSGETLWAIASQVAEEGADLRPVVSRIQRMNGLDGATIQPGQVLLLPAS
jgi:nucleoid-associated protein YgaU